MKEQEAKTKWCPHAMAAGSTNVSFNRDLESNIEKSPQFADSFNCIGSDCMMWIESEESSLVDIKDGDCGLKNRCFS